MNTDVQNRGRERIAFRPIRVLDLLLIQKQSEDLHCAARIVKLLVTCGVTFMSFSVPTRLIDSLMEGSGRVLFFVGAGFSMDVPSSLPSAFHLAQTIIKPKLTGSIARKVEDAENESGHLLSVEDIAELFLREDGNLNRFSSLIPRQEWLAAHHHVGHEVLAELWAEGLTGDIVTTNMDVLIEAGFQATLGLAPNCYTRATHFAIRPSPPRVYKIHGCLHDEETMVWAKSHLESTEWQQSGQESF